MKDVFEHVELQETEIASIKLNMKVWALFEKLRPLFKNKNAGGPSSQVINLTNILSRINKNIVFTEIMLDTLINEVVIPKERR